MSNEGITTEQKTNNPEQTKACPFGAWVVINAQGLAVSARPCPMNSKPSVLLPPKPFCPDWDEAKKECKWILARDILLTMSNGIVKPS